MVVIGIPTYEPMCLQNLVIVPSRKILCKYIKLKASGIYCFVKYQI